LPHTISPAAGQRTWRLTRGILTPEYEKGGRQIGGPFCAINVFLMGTFTAAGWLSKDSAVYMPDSATKNCNK